MKSPPPFKRGKDKFSMSTPKQGLTFEKLEFPNIVESPQFTPPKESKPQRFRFKKSSTLLKDENATKIDQIIYHVKKLAAIHLQTLGNSNRKIQDCCQYAFNSFFSSFRQWVLSGNMETQQIIYHKIVPLEELKERQVQASEQLTNLLQEYKIWNQCHFEPQRIPLNNFNYLRKEIHPHIEIDPSLISSKLIVLIENFDQALKYTQTIKSHYSNLRKNSTELRELVRLQQIYPRINQQIIDDLDMF